MGNCARSTLVARLHVRMYISRAVAAARLYYTLLQKYLLHLLRICSMQHASFYAPKVELNNVVYRRAKVLGPWEVVVNACVALVSHH